MSWVAAAVGGGLALGGIGSYVGAQSANKAANRQLQGQQAELENARNRQGFAMFGPQDWADFQLAMQPETYQTGGSSGFFGIGKKKPTTVNQASKVQQARDRFFGKYGTGWDTVDKTNKQFIADSESDLSRMMDNTRGIDQLFAGSEDAINAFGNAGEDRIRRDAADALTNANQQAVAGLSGLGMNTLVANQQGQNARRINEGASNAITNLQDTRLQRTLGVRGQRANMLGGRRAAEESTRSALSRTRYAAGRENSDRMLALFGGGAFSPQTPVLGASQSALGSAFGSIGQGLTSVGGYKWGQMQQ